MRNPIDKDLNKLEKEQVKVGVKQVTIIQEQERVIEATNVGIDKLNSDMKALRIRLKPYLKPKAVFDESYYGLMDRYENKLSERSSLERARIIAEESISASKLQRIPGQDYQNA